MSKLQKILLLFLLFGPILLLSSMLFWHFKQKKVQSDVPVATPTISTLEPEEKPFPLHDQNAQYHIEGNTLYYVSSNGIRPIGINISADTKLSVSKYEGKNIILEGKFVEEKKEVACIKAPCEPMIVRVIHIDTITEVGK